jgi:rare lipoprotein A
MVLSGVLLGGFAFGGCSGASPRFTTKGNAEAGVALSSTHQLAGIASYYADEFQGRKTANGEIFDMYDLTAAHRTLPFNTKLKVRNLENNLSVVVRINDRGPFKDDRVIDLSLAAAKKIGLVANGTAPVQLEIIEFGPALP